MQSFCQPRYNGVDHTILSISVPRSNTNNRNICLKIQLRGTGILEHTPANNMIIR